MAGPDDRDHQPVRTAGHSAVLEMRVSGTSAGGDDRIADSEVFRVGQLHAERGTCILLQWQINQIEPIPTDPFTRPPGPTCWDSCWSHRKALNFGSSTDENVGFFRNPNRAGPVLGSVERPIDLPRYRSRTHSRPRQADPGWKTDPTLFYLIHSQKQILPFRPTEVSVFSASRIHESRPVSWSMPPCRRSRNTLGASVRPSRSTD